MVLGHRILEPQDHGFVLDGGWVPLEFDGPKILNTKVNNAYKVSSENARYKVEPPIFGHLREWSSCNEV